VGSGSAEKVVQALHGKECNLLIFDDDLSPAQQRNWESLAKVPVTDRHGLILPPASVSASGVLVGF
jgi:GTP-binding protein HflX